MNNHPFRIGQKVVCIDKSCYHVWPPNVPFTVYANYRCPVCGEWHTQILESDDGVFGQLDCTFCGSNMAYGVHLGTDSKSFAPIEENRIKYVAVSETLREKAVEIAAIETN